MVEDRRKRGPNRRLDSWKEIASYFGRDERTVKRWEKDRGLPVRRLPGTRGGVYAFTDDLTQWMQSRHRSAADSEAQQSSDSTLPNLDAAGANRADGVSAEAVAEEIDVGDGQLHHADGRSEGEPRGSWERIAALLALVILVVGAGVMLWQRLARGDNGRRENASATSHHAPSPQAQDLYLQGRYYWNKRTPDDLKKALGFFQQAAASDPGYALAYVGVADCYNLLREYAAMPEAEAYRKAIEAARKAVELDPSLADAHTSLAFDLFFGMLNKNDAEQEFHTALQLDPSYALAHHWYASYLMTVGRSAEALQQIEIARQLNSSSRSILADKGLILYYAGKKDEAVALLRQLEETEPTFVSPHRYMARIELMSGNSEAYVTESKTAAKLTNDQVEMAIVNAAEQGLKSGGRQGMLTAMLHAQEKEFAGGHLTAYRVAETYALLGMKDQALEYLYASLNRHETDLAALQVDPLLQSLRGDPSYLQLAAQAGLA